MSDRYPEHRDKARQLPDSRVRDAASIIVVAVIIVAAMASLVFAARYWLPAAVEAFLIEVGAHLMRLPRG